MEWAMQMILGTIIVNDVYSVPHKYEPIRSKLIGPSPLAQKLTKLQNTPCPLALNIGPMCTNWEILTKLARDILDYLLKMQTDLHSIAGALAMNKQVHSLNKD